MEILIIGGIAAGMSTAAKALRENKEAKITVVEQSDYISFGACGLPYYLGDKFEDSDLLFARSVEQMIDAGLNILVEHKALSVDFENKSVEILNLKTDTTFNKSYDKLMIATGASANLLNVEGVNSDNVYTITRLNSVEKLKSNLKNYQNIVVVGGGFIGVEVAEQLATLNKNVTLLQSSEYIMNTYDSEFSLKIKEALEKLGVLVKVNSRVKSFNVQDDLVKEVVVNDTTYVSDAVIMAVGFTPNTQFLNNQLETLDNGAIIIDKYGQTSKEDVFAAGDCATVINKFENTTYLPLATYANKLGRIIGVNIVSDKSEWLAFDSALATSAIKVGDYEAISTGLTEKRAKALNFDYKTTLITTANHPSYYPNQSSILIKLVYDAKTYVLYGAQLFGKDGTVLRATGYSSAIYANLTTKEIGYIDFAYAPPFSSTWEALNVAANTAK